MFFVEENAFEATGSFPVLTQARTETGSLSNHHTRWNGSLGDSCWGGPRVQAGPSPGLCLGSILCSGLSPAVGL